MSDVIAALTALSTYRYYKLKLSKLADRVCGDPSQSDYWRDVLKQHPEFFRFSTDIEGAEVVSLVWRRQFPKRFDPKMAREIERDAFDALSSSEKSQISRRPLSSSELSVLVDIAIQMHEKAADRRKSNRWWVQLVLPFIGAFSAVALDWLM
ncbi:hypothetical protein [Pseudovibrio sp. SPO723]|uniref:hypothetical protein n=1 Tax=Nesiotobacter zosterae TaxID=392721 RepID=UPI0029C3252A|nr:hypothetical protein [Pseudovibrio sp. SPO723]MDX5594573.1 hypothetical protein [Pseudovibrio sp. SPO723]